jgi:hypothetical protein
MRKTPVPISGILFFWAGFVSSISFMEAWLKFRAPGVTLETGLSIGKLIFLALNRMEWVFVFLLVIGIFPRVKQTTKKFLILTGTVLLILIAQTFLLLPELNERAEMIIAGNEPGDSPVHLLFGIAEVIKVIILLFLGFYSTKLFSSRYEKDNENRKV